jgi:gamma-glutamyltranspeptidase
MPHFASIARYALQKNEEIVASSEDEPSNTVLARELAGVHKVMTEAVVGSSPRFFSMGAVGRCRWSVILNVVEFGMDIPEAIDAPRIAFVEPSILLVEPEIEPSLREQLAAIGYEVKVRSIGNAHALAIEYDENGRPVRFTGASGRRGAGLALKF